MKLTKTNLKRAKENYNRLVEQDTEFYGKMYRARKNEFEKLSKEEQDEVNEYYMAEFITKCSYHYRDLNIDDINEYDEPFIRRINTYKERLPYCTA